MRITKLIAAVVGIPMILGSVAMAIAGGVALAAPDDDGWVSTGPVHIETDAAALVGDNIEIDFGRNARDGRSFVSWGEIPSEIEVTSRNQKSVFVGIAKQSDAQVFLEGVAVDRLSSFDGDHDVEHVQGTYQAIAPTEADIWVASTVDGVLEWDIRPGEWAIVALNADGSPGIDVGVTAAAKIPFLTTLGAILIALGLIGMTTGGMLTYYGVRRVRTSQPSRVPPSHEPIVAG
ncbi:MAG: hypothetical protein GY722_29550 [bacterium]|nr:hypothetical protein [bacterium]